jgi:hypothetical protein
MPLLAPLNCSRIYIGFSMALSVVQEGLCLTNNHQPWHVGTGDAGQGSRSAWESLRESIRRSSDLLPSTKQLAHRSSFKWEPLGIPGRHHRLSSFREASGVGTLYLTVGGFLSKEVVPHCVMGQQKNCTIGHLYRETMACLLHC